MLGLGLAISDASEFNIFKQLVASKKLSKPVFSVYLSQNMQEQDNSEITFGEIRHERFSGKMHYAPISDAG